MIRGYTPNGDAYEITSGSCSWEINPEWTYVYELTEYELMRIIRGDKLFARLEEFDFEIRRADGELERVRREKWIRKNGYLLCPVCGHEAWEEERMRWKCCPICETKMEGVRDEA